METQPESATTTHRGEAEVKKRRKEEKQEELNEQSPRSGPEESEPRTKSLDTGTGGGTRSFSTSKTRSLGSGSMQKEHIVDVCQRSRRMSVKEVNDASSRLPGYEPSKVPTEARDLGRPVEPPVPYMAHGHARMGNAGRTDPLATHSTAVQIGWPKFVMLHLE